MCELKIVCVSVASMYFSARSIDHSIHFFFPLSVRMFHFPPDVTVAVETMKETVFFLIVRERRAECGAAGDLGSTFVV